MMNEREVTVIMVRR